VHGSSSIASSPARDAGFSLTEALISVALMLVLFGSALPALRQTTFLSHTVGNRSEMHGSVRGATELMQQEIGQAGRITLPGPVALAGTTVAGVNTVALTSTAGLFPGAQIIVGTGELAETVTVTALDTATVTATFGLVHASGEPVQVLGAFASGVVPPSMTDGSTGTVLKLYGDLNDDGQMVYLEYTCDMQTGQLYRNVMPWNAVGKPALTQEMVLLTNVIPNPGGAPCFTYQTETVTTTTFVTGVAVTLSVRSQQRDMYSKQFQQATKTLLNVSPRNIFLVWSMRSIGITNRLQPMPPSILALLP
jgi:hypothetical protein